MRGSQPAVQHLTPNQHWELRKNVLSIMISAMIFELITLWFSTSQLKSRFWATCSQSGYQLIFCTTLVYNSVCSPKIEAKKVLLLGRFSYPLVMIVLAPVELCVSLAFKQFGRPGFYKIIDKNSRNEDTWRDQYDLYVMCCFVCFLVKCISALAFFTFIYEPHTSKQFCAMKFYQITQPDWRNLGLNSQTAQIDRPRQSIAFDYQRDRRVSLSASSSQRQSVAPKKYAETGVQETPGFRERTRQLFLQGAHGQYQLAPEDANAGSQLVFDPPGQGEAQSIEIQAQPKQVERNHRRGGNYALGSNNDQTSLAEHQLKAAQGGKKPGGKA